MTHPINHRHAHPPSQKIIKLCDSKIGTANTNDEFLTELTLEECKELDDRMFSCQCCDWWCSTDELNEGPAGEQWCDDCKATEDGDG